MTTSLHHLAITATDLAKSAQGYDAILGVLGYRRHITADTICTWSGPQPEILLYPAEGDDRTPHQHGRPGWQHAAFSVADRDTVHAAHQAAVDGGWTIVHPPQEYDYTPGYFATFIEDPDGIRLEVAHIPDLPDHG
ncbi:VOC family protein [Micromonospora sp. NPDC092111]|uniref:VOC family protein n=1 Tax=Micromonospora sp. NPDC092111 TaxID=3364289 RepID=UPI0037F977CB